MSPGTREAGLRADAAAIYDAAVDAVRPSRMIAGVSLDDWLARPLGDYGRVRVAAVGKSAFAMAAALERRLGARIDAGAALAPHGYLDSAPLQALPIHIERLEAGHPIPDEAGTRAAERLLHLAGAGGPEDLLIVLISGGGSALMAAYADGVSLNDARKTTNLLLRSGAAIHEINTVRKHLSRILGGRLASAAAPAEVLALIVSDVIGDDLATIASGPAVPDPTTFADALGVIGRHGLRGALPAAVREHLEAGLRGEIPETPKPGDTCFVRVSNELIATNRLALKAAAHKARELGYETVIESDTLQGEAREAGRRLARLTLDLPGGRPLCRLWGGETTVTVSGTGLGGRNQELALAAAIEMDGAERRALLLSGGTDGIDGPTPAAGAWADPGAAERARRLGLDPAASLANNDSYGFFSALGELLAPGPTHVNVMDIQVCLSAGKITKSHGIQI